MWQFLVYMSWVRLNFGMTWGICQILKFYLAVSCTTKSTVIHSFSIQCPRIASSIISSLLQHSLLKSETIPEMIKVSNTSPHLGIWWQKHQTMAFVQGSGTATLSPLNYIFFEESSRPNHKEWWQRLQRCNYIVKRWLTRCLTTCFYHPVLVSSQTHTRLSSKLSKQDSSESRDYTVLGHCSHLIIFISCINHDSLTFIVEVMGWSRGLGDSSRGDKCCYLLRARINRVCVQKDRGRVGKKKKKNWTQSMRAPKRLLCSKKCWTEQINKHRMVDDSFAENARSIISQCYLVISNCCCSSNDCSFQCFRVCHVVVTVFFHVNCRVWQFTKFFVVIKPVSK